MSELKITKIVLTEKDIITCITNELSRQGLKVTKDIEGLKIGSQYVGYGVSERLENFVEDVIIECEKEN